MAPFGFYFPKWLDFGDFDTPASEVVTKARGLRDHHTFCRELRPPQFSIFISCTLHFYAFPFICLLGNTGTVIHIFLTPINRDKIKNNNNNNNNNKSSTPENTGLMCSDG